MDRLHGVNIKDDAKPKLVTTVITLYGSYCYLLLLLLLLLLFMFMTYLVWE